MTGCNSETVNTNSDTSFFTSEYNVSIIEKTESVIIEESSSELSATVAQGYESLNEVNSKPTAQSQEIKTESSAAEIEPSAVAANNNPQTSVIEDDSSTPVKNATAADTREVADKVIFYLNKARAGIGGGELSKLSGLTRYAEYRSGQLISNFSHDPGDWNKAAEATDYGKYIDLSESGGTPQGYYDIGAREAIAMAGIVGSTDRIAETLAQIIIDSPRHWSYVGSDAMKYTGVGVSCNSDMWYATIMVTNTTDYEN